MTSPYAATWERIERCYRCQFCGEQSPVEEWGEGGDKCPRCGRLYDWMIAQDEEDE